jgi:hypothetical protein
MSQFDVELYLFRILVVIISFIFILNKPAINFQTSMQMAGWYSYEPGGPFRLVEIRPRPSF